MAMAFLFTDLYIMKSFRAITTLGIAYRDYILHFYSNSRINQGKNCSFFVVLLFYKSTIKMSGGVNCEW